MRGHQCGLRWVSPPCSAGCPPWACPACLSRRRAGPRLQGCGVCAPCRMPPVWALRRPAPPLRPLFRPPTSTLAQALSLSSCSYTSLFLELSLPPSGLASSGQPPSTSRRGLSTGAGTQGGGGAGQLGPTRSWGGGGSTRSGGCGPWRQADWEPSIGLARPEASGWREREGGQCGCRGSRGLGEEAPSPGSHPCLGPACGFGPGPLPGAGHQAPEPWEGSGKALLSAEKAAGFVL